MNHTATAAAPAATEQTFPPAGLLFLLALACGVIAANLYYAQPLIGPISAAIGLDAKASGLIVTLTQIGYGVGLLFIVPLGDLIENRRLVLCALLFTLGALLIAAASSTAWLFLTSSFFIGIGSVAVQVLVPYAAHLTPEAHRSRAVGSVMTGLALGIMLARPAASALAELWNWHAVFVASAVAVAILIVVLSRKLPQRRPTARTGYLPLLRSMGRLLLERRISPGSFRTNPSTSGSSRPRQSRSTRARFLSPVERTGHCGECPWRSDPRLRPFDPDVSARLNPSGVIDCARLDAHDAFCPIALGDMKHACTALIAELADHVFAGW